MIFRYTDKFVDFAGEQLFDYVNDNPVSVVVTYLTNSSYRVGIQLSPWLEEMVATASGLTKAVAFDLIPTSADNDAKAIAALRWVINNITYKSDKSVWKLDERWQTVEETLTKRTGDCEDGAILVYVLARLLGVPANRLYIFAGEVQNGMIVEGHAFVGYRPRHYPLNFALLDWCYWATPKIIQDRNLFFMDGQKFVEYQNNDGQFSKVDSSYKKLWFAVNESKSLLSFRPKYLTN